MPLTAPWYHGNMKKQVPAKTKAKVRKTGVRKRTSSVRRSHTLWEAKNLLSEVIEENLETFKLLARY